MSFPGLQDRVLREASRQNPKTLNEKGPVPRPRLRSWRGWTSTLTLSLSFFTSLPLSPPQGCARGVLCLSFHRSGFLKSHPGTGLPFEDVRLLLLFDTSDTLLCLIPFIQSSFNNVSGQNKREKGRSKSQNHVSQAEKPVDKLTIIRPSGTFYAGCAVVSSIRASL